jgi:hypothetical protein
MNKIKQYKKEILGALVLVIVAFYGGMKYGQSATVAAGGPGARNFSGMTAARGTRGGNFGGGASVAKKMKRLFGEIERGELGKMHYFTDPEFDDRFKGELSKMPHIVVGVERSHVIELARQWMNGEKKALAENPIQLVVLQQIMEQLKAFRDYSEKIGRHDLAEIYAADMAVFATVLRDRRKMDIRNYENDHVATALAQELSSRK